MRKILAIVALFLSFSFTAQAQDFPSAGEVADDWAGYDSETRFFITGLISGSLHGIERFTNNMGYPLNEQESHCLQELFLPGSVEYAGQLVAATKGFVQELGMNPYEYAFHDAFVYFAQTACLKDTLNGPQESDSNVGS